MHVEEKKYKAGDELHRQSETYLNSQQGILYEVMDFTVLSEIEGWAQVSYPF